MFLCCSINLKRQSEHSGLRPDTSSLVLLAYLININLTIRCILTPTSELDKLQDILASLGK